MRSPIYKKIGYNPQDIFEATGFEPIQQNQVVVGAQVYSSLEKIRRIRSYQSLLRNKSQ